MANPNEQNQRQTGLNRDDLLFLIKELRKPVKSEKEQRDEAQLEADRKRMGEILQLAFRNKQQTIKDCTHMRPNGTTTAVWIGDPISKMYCQVCTGWIGPEQAELFNKLYQLSL